MARGLADDLEFPRASEIARAWAVTVREVGRPERGTNNWVRFINSSYVLRVSLNRSAIEVAAENQMLEALGATDLPFEVPRPLSTPDGRNYIATAEGPATLYPLLPGRAARGEMDDLRLIGTALGDLMLELAKLPAELAPTDWRAPLSEIHPAVPDVSELVDDLRRVMPGSAGLEVLEDQWQTLDAAYLSMPLPCQICHGDFAPSNVLIHGGEVSAVLDFEIAGWDLRVADLVAGLVQSTDTAQEEDAFLSGFRSRLEPTAEEWAAVPTLRLHRQISSVVWRAGRWREGKATSDEVRERIASLEKYVN